MDDQLIRLIAHEAVCDNEGKGMTKLSSILIKGRPAEILLVEDNYGDVILAKKAFTLAKIVNNITVAQDGLQALQILRHEGEFAVSPVPDIILLDLNLPKKSGREVLKEIKEDPRVKHIPVVILSSSRVEFDELQGAGLIADSYLIKPVSLEKFVEIAQSIEQIWLQVMVQGEPAA